MEATVAFYRLLGAKIPKAAIWSIKTGMHHVVVKFSNGMELAFGSRALARVYNKGYRTNTAGGNLVIVFGVKTRRAVDEAYKKLTEAGYKGLQPPWDAFWGFRYAIIVDPDGNHVGIMSSVDLKKQSPGPDL